MPTISSGITITLPALGASNWDTITTTAFTAISAHDHSGGGKGLQLSGAAFAADSFDDLKIKLRNNGPLRARNGAGTLDVNLLKLDATDNVELNSPQILKFFAGGAFRASFTAAGRFDSEAINDMGDVTKRWGKVHALNLNLPNNYFIEGRNSAGLANVNLIGLDANNNPYLPNSAFIPNNRSLNFYDVAGTFGALQLYSQADNSAIIASTGNLNLFVAGSRRWYIDATTGFIQPNSDVALTVGSSGNRVLSAFIKSLLSCEAIASHAGTNLNVNGDSALNLQSGGSTRLTIDATGYLVLGTGYVGGTSTKNPATDANTGWMPIKDSLGNIRYIPFYAA